MKLQGVIFDLDGVITDTAHLHFQAWQQIAAEIGISIDAQFNESLKGISRDESLRRILQHGGKEGDFNSQERAQLAYRKNLLYVHSLRELTVSAVLPGIRSLLADLRAQQIPVGLASVSLNAPTITVAFNGLSDLVAVIGLLAKRIAKESTWLSFRYNIFKKSTITRCMW